MSRLRGYAPDEFDRAAERRRLRGVHLPVTPWWRRALPVLAVLVLAPLAAWAVFTYGLRSGIDPADAIADIRGSVGEEATPAATPDPDVDRTVAVTLLDGTEDGSGEDVAAVLEEAGYENVRVSGYRAREPLGSTVFVREADVQDVGEDVAGLLSRESGGAAPEVVESADAASSAPVVVVLR